MSIDLSRGIQALLDGTSERARALLVAGHKVDAAAAYREASLLASRFAIMSDVPAEKQRRRDQANIFMDLAGKCSSRSQGAHPNGNARTSDSIEHLDSQIEALIHKSKISWEQVVGMQEARDAITTAYALNVAKAPVGVQLQSMQHILLYGPPGCGKSLIAAAVSNGMDATFFNVKVSNLLSKFFGESAQLVTTLFTVARRRAPSVIFLDEVDALADSREHGSSGPERRMLASLLSELDGVESKSSGPFVMTIAATNTPWSLDAAVLSRFERQIYTPLPAPAARKQMLHALLTESGHVLEESMDDLVIMTESLSGREIKRFSELMVDRMITSCNPNLAALATLGADSLARHELRVRPLTAEDAAESIRKVRPAVSQKQLQRYQNWAESEN